MKVKEAMSTDPQTLTSQSTFQDAARMMQDCDCGMIPISEGDKLVGIITDRDMVIRGIANSKGADTKVTECMTSKVLYCFEDDDVKDIAHNMEQQHVQRLIVLNDRSSKRLSGVISVSDIAEACRQDSELAKAVSEASHKYDTASLH